MSVISKGIKTLKRAGSSIAHAGAYAGKHAAKLFNVNKGPARTPAARMPRLNRTAKRPGAAMQVNLRTAKHVTFGENTSIPFETVKPGANQVIIIDMLPPQNRMPQSQARPDSKPSRGNPPPRPTTPAPTSNHKYDDMNFGMPVPQNRMPYTLPQLGFAMANMFSDTAILPSAHFKMSDPSEWIANRNLTDEHKNIIESLDAELKHYMDNMEQDLPNPAEKTVQEIATDLENMMNDVQKPIRPRLTVHDFVPQPQSYMRMGIITELPKARMGVGLQDDTLDATTTKFVWKQKPADAPFTADPSKPESPQEPASR